MASYRLAPIQLNGSTPSSPRAASARRRSRGELKPLTTAGRRSSTGDIKNLSRIHVRPRDDEDIPPPRQRPHGYVVRQQGDGNSVQYILDKSYKDFENHLIEEARPIIKSSPGAYLRHVHTVVTKRHTSGPDAATLKHTRPRKPMKVDIERMVRLPLPSPVPFPPSLMYCADDRYTSHRGGEQEGRH